MIGYVGEVSESDLNTPEFARFHQGDIVGKDGIEREYNDILTGTDGQRRVEVDSFGNERRVLIGGQGSRFPARRCRPPSIWICRQSPS